MDTKKTTTLDLRNTELTNNHLTLSQSLRSIQLSNCQLTSFPDDLRNCFELHNLNLSHNQIQQIPSETIARLQKLKYLSINNNELSTFPYEASSCVCLEELYIQGNNLSGAWPLPELFELQKLNISNNSITTLYTKRMYPNLKNLNASNNSITTVPLHIGELETVILSSNRIDSLPIAAWSDGNENVQSHKKCQLKKLLVDDNLLKDSDLTSKITSLLICDV